ncbi:M12 family metallo-peptidase [Pedobacter helvus]|uniref:M12 family metallo-peptidase n=1 Tax=Pedobacter helvus TaxID=2563444 RepID=A0ABW9JHJ7_9SPHI|nr:M12 family metallo-peptidase [Pedobacter ureilyticus]
MKKHLLFLCFLIVINITSSFSQEIIQAKSIILNEKQRSNLTRALKKYEVFSLDLAALNLKVSNVKEQFQSTLFLGKQEYKITLQPNEIRAINYTSSTNSIYDTNNITNCITYAGYVDKNIKDDVRLLITDSKIRGYITKNGEKLYITQLLNFDFKESSKDILIIYKPEDVIDTSIYCGVSNSQEQLFLQREVQSKTINSTTNNNCRILELATDADYEFYQRHGSSSNNEILAIINMIEGLYQSTFNMKINVTHQNLWTTSNDPFTGSPSTDTGSELLVNQLRTHWENNMQNVNRDLVHLFSGQEYNEGGIVGRVYEIGTVCSARNKSYGFTKDRINQFLTTAHEIGHNFGGIHSDGQNCGTSSASIMCQGEKAFPMYFSSASITRMTNFMNANSSCMAIYYTMTGPSQICTTATYSIPNVPLGSTVTWNVAGTYSIVGGSSTVNPVTIQRTSNGYGTLTATITNN